MELSPVMNMVWQLACIETIACKWEVIETEHFLAALIMLKRAGPNEVSEELRAQGFEIAMLRPEMDLVSDVLAERGINPEAFRRQLRERFNKGTYRHAKGETIHRSDRSRVVFTRAESIAREMSAVTLKAAHFFLAILEEKDSAGCKLLNEKGADLTTLAEATHKLMKGQPAPQPAGGQRLEQPQEPPSGTPFLDRIGRDLTKEAREGKLGPIIGRRKEILQVIQTLARQSKNNPVLVGEAGVGKTAIVEAIAVRAVQGKDPQVLAGKRIVELNMGALTAGTKYRGEFEDRLTRILNEASSHPEIILFLDELHTVIGAGRAEGSMDAANLMKPALARGSLRCIGATTVAEYRRHIETDSALERRFEKVLVPEPSRDETLEILTGLRPKWEKHHCVKIDDMALMAAVDLSVRFDCDHQLPDKAIDLVDKAGARIRVPVLSMKQGKKNKGNATTEPDSTSANLGEVTALTIARVLSEKMGIPVEVITGQLDGMNRSRLLDMETTLKMRVIGQNQAVERVCQRLCIAQAGLAQRRGPLSVFLFLGPTGVGKTELARSVASFLFGAERDLIRLDMSEFMEEHSSAKLIGSPPGYIGHEEEGQLTGRLRSRPYSVVLLDEIEKAHPRVLDLFLQVFDEGRLTDAKGRTTDARNAIFILTSNICPEKRAGIGFGTDSQDEFKETVVQALQGQFRTEFINRIDEIILFRPLDLADVRAILEPMLEEVGQALREKHAKPLRITPEVRELLTAQGYSAEFGVRHLRRTVQTLIEMPLSQLVLSGEIKDWLGVSVTLQNGRVVFQPLSVKSN